MASRIDDVDGDGCIASPVESLEEPVGLLDAVRCCFEAFLFDTIEGERLPSPGVRVMSRTAIRGDVLLSILAALAFLAGPPARPGPERFTT